MFGNIETIVYFCIVEMQVYNQINNEIKMTDTS